MKIGLLIALLIVMDTLSADMTADKSLSDYPSRAEELVKVLSSGNCLHFAYNDSGHPFFGFDNRVRVGPGEDI